MEQEVIKKLKYNFGFYLGLVLCILGIFWVEKWWIIVFGLVVMVLVRMLELDKDDEDSREVGKQ
jgi:protein-S-isoprenylcysteine O-methyltransferase Ste14